MLVERKFISDMLELGKNNIKGDDLNGERTIE
jgi:hypothetical protein